MEILSNINLYHYLFLALIIFCIGIGGLFFSQNIIKKILSYEIILSAVGINFISFAVFLDRQNLEGLILHFFILIIFVIQIVIAIILLIISDKNNHPNAKKVIKDKE